MHSFQDGAAVVLRCSRCAVCVNQWILSVSCDMRFQQCGCFHCVDDVMLNKDENLDVKERRPVLA